MEMTGPLSLLRARECLNGSTVALVIFCASFARSSIVTGLFRNGTNAGCFPGGLRFSDYLGLGVIVWRSVLIF